MNRREEIMKNLDDEIESMARDGSAKGLDGLDYDRVEDIDLLRNARIMIGSVFRNTTIHARKG